MISFDDHTVFVEAAARLHFGVLDLRGDLGRWFGGIGAAAESPALLVSARRTDALEVDGEDADRAAAFARRFLEHHGIKGGASLHVHRALPRHAGLGSGTQLALAVGSALAEINGISTDATDKPPPWHTPVCCSDRSCCPSSSATAPSCGRVTLGRGRGW